MKQQDYHCEIIANVSAKEAFESISKGVPEWWTPNFTGSSEKVDDEFTVRFGDTFVDFRIAESVPTKKIVWEVTDCYLHWLADKTEWMGTKLIWAFSTENGQTKIDMTHVGLVPEIECYDNCMKGWDFFVKQSLYKLLTEKKGMPNQPQAARAEVDA